MGLWVGGSVGRLTQCTLTGDSSARLCSANPSYVSLPSLQETVPEGSSSLVNEKEAEMVLQLYRELRHRHAALIGAKPSVAVISPYKAQVRARCGALVAALVANAGPVCACCFSPQSVSWLLC